MPTKRLDAYRKQADGIFKRMAGGGGTVNPEARTFRYTLLGDSTGNEDTEWFRLGVNAWAAAHTTYTVKYRQWDTATDTGYGAYTTVQTGTGTLPDIYEFDNASKGDTTFAYQTPLLSLMLPGPTTCILSSSHNYTDALPDAYETTLDNFVTAIRAVQSGAPIAFSSQNPRRSPANFVNPHRARLVRGKSWAENKGYEYIFVLEAWELLTDTVRAGYMNADGIHPTKGANSGSSFWGGIFKDWMDGVDPNIPTGGSTIRSISADKFRSAFGTRIFPSYQGKTGGELVNDPDGLKYLTDLNPGFVTHKMTPDIPNNVITLTKTLWTTYGIKSMWTMGEPHSYYTDAEWTTMKNRVADCGDALIMVTGQNEVNNERASALARSVTFKQLVNDVVTLTLANGVPGSAHPGNGVRVAGVGAPFDGTFTISGKTATTISYRKVAADVAKVSANGTATLPILPPDWKNQARDHQIKIWNMMNVGATAVNNVRVGDGKNKILVGNPNVWSGDDAVHDRDGALLFPEIKTYVDGLNFHLYPRGGDPNYKLDEYVTFYRTHMDSNSNPTKPLYCSEAGYFVADNYTGGAKVVTEWAHDIYIRKMHLEYALRGFGVSQFEFLCDPDPPKTNRESTFGYLEMVQQGVAANVHHLVQYWTKRDIYNKHMAILNRTGGTAKNIECEITTSATAPFKYLAVTDSVSTKLYLWRPVELEVNRVKQTVNPITVSVKTASGTQTVSISHDVEMVTI